ncbi:hypothetical protein HMPREF6745_0861 [Prevotella sp. oral taxon 472 str. F0295]|nr:hypothetical protein [Prevotella sp. oral taxon 472]EEX53747.1 hypothetical protein HMPREF6745_0861 [Prevotella sp. oral taxon 472 str. F0295]
MKSQIYIDQITSGFVQDGINTAQQLYTDRITKILQIAIEKESYARTNLSESLQCIENLRDFVSSPENILGNIQTKHGEIAEHIEVEIRNGRDILNHIKPTATFEGVGRTAPEDYILNGTQVQSKYIAGVGKSLNHVLEHLHKYPGFTDNGFYHIPKDQYELLEKVYNGENIDGITSRTIRKCQETIKQIEEETSKPFAEVIRPGLSTYDEVQYGKVNDTIDRYENEFKETSDKEIKKIRTDRKQEESDAQHITEASWGEVLKYGAISAVITGTTSAGLKVYSKIKEGTKITEFTLKDWKEVGFDFGKGSVKGAISGTAIYGMTKVAGFSAPFASAVVSSTMGLHSIYYDYKKGIISKSEYADAACALSLEAGIAAIGSAIGQAVIPVPFLGAIVGSAIAKSSFEISKHIMGKKESKFIKELKKQYDELITELNKECREIIALIDNYFNKLGGLIEAALNPDINKSLLGSVELCRFVGIEEKQIIHNPAELDDFMLS